MFDWGSWGYLSAFALIAWVPFGLWLFSRERPARAGAHTLIWGMMWLPEGAVFDLPALPPFSKYTFAAVTALLGTYIWARPRFRAARIGRGYDWIVLLMVLGQIGTVVTNQDMLRYGSWKFIELPGFTLYDGIAAAARVVLQVGIPFILGRALLRTERDLNDVLHVLVAAGLVYSLPILYELRMSPMLHVNVYGYAPRDDWAQNLRQGGYRPTVFMGHGLVVGFFQFLSAVAAVTLHKAGKRRLYGVPMSAVVGYLFVILVLCKAAAALIYGMAGFLVLRYLSVKAQMRLLLVLGMIVVSYPAARVSDVFPAKALISIAENLGPERVQSLQFRFDNEDVLVIKGNERPWFGWGGYGRERIYDAETGKDLVIQDGHWIAVFGQQGWVGFVGFFALLLWPLVEAARGMKRITSKAQRTLLAGLGFIVALCSVNMLPNMQLPVLQFYFAAGLAVLIRELPKQAAQSKAKPVSSVAPPPATTSEPPPVAWPKAG